MTVRDYNLKQLEGFLLTAKQKNRVEVCELVLPNYKEVLGRYKKVVEAYRYASEEYLYTHADKEKSVGEYIVERHQVIYLLAIDLKVKLIDAWNEGQAKLVTEMQSEHRAMRKAAVDGVITPEQYREFRNRPRDERIDWARFYEMMAL